MAFHNERSYFCQIFKYMYIILKDHIEIADFRYLFLG